jgi:hypothetical protein
MRLRRSPDLGHSKEAGWQCVVFFAAIPLPPVGMTLYPTHVQAMTQILTPQPIVSEMHFGALQLLQYLGRYRYCTTR